MKKVATFLLAAVLYCVILSGCGNNAGSEMIAEARTVAAFPISVSPVHDEYGMPAYELVKQIQSCYPGRIAGTKSEREMALFILSILLEGGYSETDVSVNSFVIPNSVPAMEEPNNKYDCGKKSNNSQNIGVIKRGEREETIIVGAHYDSAGTHGVDDNGSGVSVVLENALRMIDSQTYYTIRYVFFGSEEIGMCGSSAFVKALSQKEIENIVLMINVDGVLAGDYLYIYGGHIDEQGNINNTEAVLKAAETAKKISVTIQLPPEGNPDYPFPTGQKRSDHAPFNDIGIPYIYFSPNNWETGSPVETKEYGIIMHTEKDDLDFIEDKFGDRAKNTLISYSTLLYKLLQEEW